MDFRLTLIPFDVAVKAVHKQVHGYDAGPPTDEAAEQRLNAIASAMAKLVPIYEYDPDPDVTARPLLKADLSGAVFARGGKEITYADGRPATPLAVSVNGVDVVARRLKEGC